MVSVSFFQCELSAHCLWLCRGLDDSAIWSCYWKNPTEVVFLGCRPCFHRERPLPGGSWLYCILNPLYVETGYFLLCGGIYLTMVVHTTHDEIRIIQPRHPRYLYKNLTPYVEIIVRSPPSSTKAATKKNTLAAISACCLRRGRPFFVV